MPKGRRNVSGSLCVAALLAITIMSDKIKLPVALDITTIVPEIFSLAAVNASYERKTLLEEIKDGINERKISPQRAETEVIQEETKNVEIIEKSVTVNKDVADYENVFLTNHTSFNINLKELMSDYNPPKRKKVVQILIIHTHATEGYVETKDSRSTQTDINMIAVGNVFEEALESYGFNVVHDVKLHDYPSYNGSYSNSLKTMNWYMEHYPKIDIIFDLHRDAVDTKDNSRVKFGAEIDGQKVAQLMLVVGTNEGGLKHETWKENLKFAIGLQNQTMKMYPTLMRPLDLRKERFNQHVTNNSIIVEVGSNGNTIEEAKKGVKYLAKALNEYIL